MQSDIDRRAFLTLAGLGGAVFATGLHRSAIAADRDFFFVQITDTHWGFEGPAANPDPRGTLPRAIAAVNALPRQPDFIIFTGDLTHITEDAQERRRRLREFQGLTEQLTVKTRYFIPGEHDASLDRGQAYSELFGKPFHRFDHKGIHFFALDNTTDPKGAMGQTQLDWLKSELAGIDRAAPIVVFAHRPLFDLYPQWDWATQDGAAAIDLLMPYRNVTVFYGHIHQQHSAMTGHIAHHAAQSLIFPLPPPGSQPRRAPVPWNPEQPYAGLGTRGITVGDGGSLAITEQPLHG
jgi:hypothetical protein